ncbi:spore morphogenesis/germination protein YwcE [Paenactinomyces guangxiensis]|uniref:Spore gernimation protein n=1 Tax=Paenactinomyces guangxiensis TaxID=1490290 RepID=A0A7W1WNJ1_9BACL|nr:spore morphogenesis/germination protein YwcE [Paenactinomyces guangxiensis]MBA4493180.1 spore gernimation protein [Paenactinomyces guangxiensis]MBH8589970.1 spore gernimation protein [Paenactinomyces guangxiensis]
MSVFMVYLFVASATPLFLWTERRRLALLHLPFIVAMWVYFILYVTTELSVWSHLLFGIIFIGNIIFAHVAAFLIFASPVLERRHRKI